MEPAQSSKETPLTYKKLISQSFPMILTFFMISGSAPIVTGGISWKFGAEGETLHLSSFLLAFVTAIFLYSPAFSIRNVSIRVVKDKTSLKMTSIFYCMLATISAGFIILVAQNDYFGSLVFEKIYRASPAIAQLAREGLFIFCVAPFLVVFRGIAQGWHISHGKAGYVGKGSLIRMITMALFVFGFAIHQPSLTGPQIGGFTYIIGIGVEMIYVLFMLKKTSSFPQASETHIYAIRKFIYFAMPLIFANMIQQFLTPITIIFIEKCQFPEESLGGYEVLKGTIWFGLSMITALQPMFIQYASSRKNLKKLLKFALLNVSIIIAVLATLVYTGLKIALYVGILRIDNQLILNLLFETLFWIPLLPLVNMTWFVLAALHTRAGTTYWITAGNFMALVTILIFGKFLDFSHMNGILLAFIIYTGFHCISLAIQALGLLISGLEPALKENILVE